mgnify:CR=1 FL=1
MKVKRALVSVSDKQDLEPFVRGLVELGVEVISTGGTARHLGDAGLPITGISDVTDFPEIVELDINPLMVFEQGRGVLGIDMRLALK